jgi:ribonuclease HII
MISDMSLMRDDEVGDSRKEFIHNIHDEFPMYDWHKNKGYPSPSHRAFLAQYGMCKYHRKTFKNPANTLTLF